MDHLLIACSVNLDQSDMFLSYGSLYYVCQRSFYNLVITCTTAQLSTLLSYKIEPRFYLAQPNTLFISERNRER